MILLTGASGLLGRELQKYRKFLCPTHEELDITLPKYKWQTSVADSVRLIVHSAAYTDVPMAEIEKEKCYLTNVLGTRNLTTLNIPMLYISTEYVFDGEKGNYSEEDYPNPKNFYALTKLLGEYESRRTDSVVVRCLFKPRPFEHEAACVDQWTTGDYVDKIAGEINYAIEIFRELPRTIHIGSERKSTFDLARESRSVIKITRESIGAVKIPKDTSLNTSKWKEIKRARGICE